MRRPGRARWALVGVGVAAVLVVGGVVLAQRADAPVLLDPADFTGVTEVQEPGRGQVPGTSWCVQLEESVRIHKGDPATKLALEDGVVGAAVLSAPGSSSGAAGLIRAAEQQATACVESDLTAQGYAIEPLDGLEDGALGWRFRDVDGGSGELVLAPLDESRLLVVGQSGAASRLPAELDDLLARAIEGADRVGES